MGNRTGWRWPALLGMAILLAGLACGRSFASAQGGEATAALGQADFAQGVDFSSRRDLSFKPEFAVLETAPQASASVAQSVRIIQTAPEKAEVSAARGRFQYASQSFTELANGNYGIVVRLSFIDPVRGKPGSPRFHYSRSVVFVPREGVLVREGDVLALNLGTEKIAVAKKFLCFWKLTERARLNVRTARVRNSESQHTYSVSAALELR